MRIGEVDLPEQLLDAQQAGRLVIFAGAGVSVAPPSNYPQLKEIAEIIAKGSSAKRREDEPVDRFLGRLTDEGIDVHEKLKELLTNPRSRPSSLHLDLLKLFSSAREVRLVTTNFDAHFNTAAGKVFDESVEIYYAPALPLGYDISGIVYLHGNVEKDPGRIVLTDGDFGRAYLTEGWSRRFLQDLFATYTVLFVGYSHNDPVMNYLARGLPPEARGLTPDAPVRRYALTPSENPGHWEFLGIESIPYPLVDGRNSHQALADSIAEWARNSRMGEEEHHRRIRKLLEQGPPGEDGTADYIGRALRDRAKLGIFARYARGPQWLDWAEKQGLLDSLCEPGKTEVGVAEVARWFVAEHAVRHPEEAIAFVLRHGGKLNPILWNALVERLASRERPELAPADLARWVAILLHPGQQEKSPDRLLALLRGRRLPGDSLSVLLLFEYLTRPYLSLEEGSGQRGAGKGRAEIRLEGDARGLKKAWEELFQPRLNEVAERLAAILTAHLVQAHLLLDAAEGKSTATRPRGGHSSAGLTFLITAAREVAGRLMDTRPDEAQLLVENWRSLGLPLMRSMPRKRSA